MRTLSVLLGLLPLCLVVLSKQEAISLFPSETNEMLLTDEEIDLIKSIVSVKLPEHESDQEFDPNLMEDVPEEVAELTPEEKAEFKAELKQIAEFEATDQYEKNPDWNVPPAGMTRAEALKKVSETRDLIMNGALPQNYNMLTLWDHAAYCSTDRQRWELGGRTDVDMDLHMQRRLDAVALTKRLLVWGRRLAFRQWTSCDTGKGNHSPGNIPVIQLAVETMLTTCKYEFNKRWDHIGMTGKFDINSFSTNANLGPICTTGSD